MKENFDWPYLRPNIQEFWTHWHISLTRWLTDYVFIPLGGSRVSTLGTFRNVLVTFLISGLWHGAGWNFVVWGLWHGVCLCVHRFWKSLRLPLDTAASAPRVFFSWVLTTACVVAGWAFFVMDLPTALLFFRRLLIR